jgi:hypothetical protein
MDRTTKKVIRWFRLVDNYWHNDSNINTTVQIK